MNKKMIRIFICILPRVSKSTITHLIGILASNSIPDDISIILYGPQKIVHALGPLDKNVKTVIDNSAPENPLKMHLWRYRNLNKLLEIYKPHIHFSTLEHLSKTANHKIKHVVMSRNLQPHIKEERRRFPFFCYERFRMFFLHRMYKASLEKANGVIFLTDYVKDIMFREGVRPKNAKVIPHGISETFRRKPVNNLLGRKPNIVYVSDFMEYKFQWNVVYGIDKVRKKTGVDIQLNLVGKPSKYGWPLLEKALERLNHPNWVKISRPVPYEKLYKIYHAADIFVFASTVETISNILLEAMASGLPIAYSDRRPMRDILGDDGVTFIPEKPDTIATAIEKLVLDNNLRNLCAMNAYKRSLKYNWSSTASKTFSFLREIYTKEKI